eukprot:332743_1
MANEVDDERTNVINKSLAEFVQGCHSQIRNGTLKAKKYHKTINNLLFELSGTIHWFHNNVKSCHLNITPNNILIENGEIENGKINSQIKMLLLTPSNILKDEFNDMDKTKDMYSIGVITYFCFFGDNLLDTIDNKQSRDSIHWAIKNGKLKPFLQMRGLLKKINPKILSFLNGVLNFNESKRLDSYSVITHKFFKHSEKKYGNIIDKIGCKKCDSCQIAYDLLKSKQDNAVNAIAFDDICIRD